MLWTCKEAGTEVQQRVADVDLEGKRGGDEKQANVSSMRRVLNR